MKFKLVCGHIITSALLGAPEQSCQENEFLCAAGFCIMGYKRCNGIRDCPSGNDEDGCPEPTESCADGQVQCEDGKCVQGSKCDNIFDCPDGSDERNCPYCSPGQYACANGECIDENRRCDSRPDCSDGSDEQNCVEHCPGNDFRCRNGVCLDVRRRCDGYVDCLDQSDEENCPGLTTTPHSISCPPGEFQCGDKSCISEEYRCDTFEDCSDGSDEVGCPSRCPAGEFLCDGNKCIPESRKCDNRRDCDDGLDEHDCGVVPATCASNELTCRDGSCIPGYFKCDGKSDCRDGSDESDCGCRADEFQCQSGYCIRSYERCNGRNDCGDNSDEVNCGTERPTTAPETTPRPTQPYPISCPRGQLPCSSGYQCYPQSGFCDGRYDCSDGSDEINCSGDGLNLKTYPNEQTIKESREVVFQCRDEGVHRARVHWMRGNGLPLPPNSQDHNGRLEIPNIQLEHSGEYVCVAIGYPPNTPGSQVRVTLSVETFTPPAIRPPTACALHEATCSNGDCIQKHLVCDGKYDCRDGSDETRCNPHGCEPNEFRCSNKRCVLKTWRCDGDDDCGDGSDEANCATNPPGSACQYSQFACHSGNQCIPKSFHCDHERDCVDGSDEVGCSSVVISKPPPPMVNLNVGDLFIIACTAVGVPTPEVVWRLNWGHIPDKCTTTSVNGIGTLTCPNIQIEDQGAYSCEAINIRGSVFAVPDTILVIGKPHTVCPNGYFNEEASNPQECLPCFCFGATSSCRSADLFTYQLQPPFDSHKYIGVRVDSNSGVLNVRDEPIYPGAQPRVTPMGRSGVHAELAAPYGQPVQPDVVPYFSMPENYHGNQLKSFGGYLKYTLRYEGRGRPTTNAPDVIITGNGYTLLHVGQAPQASQDNQISVRFFVGDWVKRSETAPESLATREEIMMVLENVDNILIKLQYVDGHLDTSLTDIEMDSAAVRNTGLGQAVYVEECSCPVGYTGLSCESCDYGYDRHRSGPWLGQCYKKEPESCPSGHYGDPARGIACEICPCPLTNPSNQFGRTCYLDTDGDATCQCPQGYIGRRCEQCAAGWTGNPLIPGDSCRPGTPGGTCNADGSISTVPDGSGRCACKLQTDGPTCNQCKPNSFHLSASNQYGCISCFCMGITTQCTSSSWYRDEIRSVFTSSRNEFKLVDNDAREAPIEDGIRLDQRSREIVYSDFSSRQPDVYYWSLPSRYLGNKVTSYGGYLKYSLRYVPLPGGQSSRNNAPVVKLISDNDINLLYYNRDYYPQPNTILNFSIPILEQYWERADGEKADREHLLMALADIKAIQVKATYTTNTREAALISVSLDTADERNTGRERALAVEQCYCPAGYRGLSCEDCDVGFTRGSEGLYLGLCEACSCNGHSNECDAETGECVNCRDHTAGPNCDECLPGYEGNAATGSCRWSGGGSCECDPAGSISQDCYGGVCQCKGNVEGNKCDRCREGTFGLNISLVEGCQECFCSGVTDRCSESNMYIEQIPSQIIDQSNHGFTLTDQSRRESINTDFSLNVAMNEIQYFFRPSDSQHWYWSLPSTFTGNKIKSYGGRLEFTQHYSQRGGAAYTHDKDVIIIGNGVTIYWTNPVSQPAELHNKVSIELSTKDNNWHRQDYRQGPRVASRQDLLIALANIDAILVRATQSSDTASAAISDIILDTAVDTFTGQPRARNVEICRCPMGYRGSSCELCAAGYYRDVKDVGTGPLGSCARCPCSGNEESCNMGADQVVCNCLAGFSGTKCEIDNTGPTVTERPYPPPTTPSGPTIIVSIQGPFIHIVETGGNVRLNCSARSAVENIPVRIHWNKDGSALPSDRAIDDGRGILVITDVRISDSGNYICQASDGYSVVTEHTVVQVQENAPSRPQVTITPQYLEVNEGEPIELRCTALGNPQPTLQWTRINRAELNPAHTFVDGVFRIPYAQKSDEAEYSCTATNSAGYDSRSTIIYVRDYVTPPGPIIRVDISPSYFNGKTGEKFTFECAAPYGPHRSVTWSRPGGKSLPYSSTVDEGVLTVYDAKNEDSGVYICTVTSFTGQSGSENVTVVISNANEAYPVVRIYPDRQTISQSSTVEIRCDATGSPPPTIKWTKVGESLGPNSVQIGSILRIQNVQPSDAGVYSCVASNNIGLAQGRSVLDVERRDVPVIEIYPSQTQTSVEGGSISMKCIVRSGYPRPNLHWSRQDGLPLSSSTEVLSDGGLRFTRITLAEAGEYVCTAENDAGRTTAIGNLVVHTPPVISVRPSTSKLYVRLGERVRLECTATGIPQPAVQWSKYLTNRADVGVRRQDYPGMAVYEITSASLDDQGFYICEAHNSAAVSEERIELVVQNMRGDITGEDAGAGPNEVTPYPRPEYPPFKHLDQTFTAPVGTRAELRCRNEDGSRLYFTWIRGDNSTLTQNSVVHEGVLYIDNVQPSDAGEYRCVAMESGGAVVFSATVRLDVVEPPRITLSPTRQIVRPGDNAHIECSASGQQPITINWDAIGRGMPQSVYVRDGHLNFRGIQVADAGRYKCTARNTAGEADAVAEVLVQEYGSGPGTTVTAENREQTAAIGQTVMLHCKVRGGEERPSVRWFREHLPLPTNSRVSGEYLQITNIQPSDAGRYFCEVQSEGGTSSDYINLQVDSHGTLCNANEWRCDNGQCIDIHLKCNHQLDCEDHTDEYYCSGRRRRDPHARPPVAQNPELDIQATSPVVHIGDNVDLYCRSNEPGVITTWSKLSGRLSNNVQASGGSLRIMKARPDNGGMYRCEAKGRQSVYHKDYNLEIVDASNENVQDEPPIETKTAPQGSSVRIECNTDLEQPVSYHWSKPGGVLPREVNIHSRVIEINEIRGSDAGLYVCTASNGQTSMDIPTILVVTGIVPYFTQASNSFIALPTLPDAYVQFNFEISIKPETLDGLILYNGHRRATANSDFISLSLVNGIPEFRYNLGQGVAVVRGDKPVNRGEWHAIKVSRNKKKATMYVDGMGPYTATAEGRNLGLDLTEPLYLGGAPNYREIAPEVEQDTGFVGCISRFKIGHAHQDIVRDATTKVGITTCETCSENPCQNEGVCQEALTKEGYICICRSGFSGSTCSKRGGEACTPYVCGTGRCVDTDHTYNCLCPLGRAGRHCEREIAVVEPGFANDAYVAYPTPKAQRRLKVSLKFKPTDLKDGILLYLSESEEGHGDFASLTIKDRHLEFRFDVGSGPVIIRSERELQVGQWLAVTASKFLNEGRLMVNGDAPVLGRITGNHKVLNLNTPLYVGGIDKQRIRLNSGVGVTSGFNGCISEITMSGLDLDIVRSVTDAANIEDCSSISSADSNVRSNEIVPSHANPDYAHENTPKPRSFDSKKTGCSSRPCLNNGQCYPLSPVDYKCSCAPGYTGRNCEISPNVCEQLIPCQNGGTCHGETSTYTCDCPIGYTGINCEQRSEIRNEVNFNGNGYLELSRTLLSHEREDEPEVIALELSTNSSNGLIFWHGQNSNEDGQGQDFISLIVDNGFLEFSYDLGSGPAIIYNNQVRINDGERHRVILKREGKRGSMEIDNDYINEGYAEGITNTLNCNGNIYLGGTPNISLMTGGKYKDGFTGCIHGFELQDSKTLDLGAKAISGINVKACSSSNELNSLFGDDEELVN